MYREALPVQGARAQAATGGEGGEMSPDDDRPNKPQSTTEGRWELLQQARGKGEARPRRWYDVPTWYRVLDRFGMPTLFLLITLTGIGYVGKFILTKWDEHERAVAVAMTKQAEATVKLADKVEEMSDSTSKALTIMLVYLGHAPSRHDEIEPVPPPTKLPPPPPAPRERAR